MIAVMSTAGTLAAAPSHRPRRQLSTIRFDNTHLGKDIGDLRSPAGSGALVKAGSTSLLSLIERTDGVGTMSNPHMPLESMILLESILLRCPSMASYNESNVDIAEQVVKGLCAGCRDAGCVLTGEKVRKCRDFRGKRYSAHDMVGSAKGAIERGRLIMPDTGAMVSGDVSL